MLSEADLVIVMEAVHRQSLLERFPFDPARVWTLGELAGSTDDIVDPFLAEPLEAAAIFEVLDRWSRAAGSALSVGEATSVDDGEIAG
jgi:predicted protein tyrosine phosphatase